MILCFLGLHKFGDWVRKRGLSYRTCLRPNCGHVQYDVTWENL